MPSFHHSVAVLPLPFRRCRCAVPLCRAVVPVPLPFFRSVATAAVARDNGIAGNVFQTFCIMYTYRDEVSRTAVTAQRQVGTATKWWKPGPGQAVGGQRSSGHFIPIRIRKDVSSNSVLACNGNGSYGTEERQGHNGRAKRQRRNGNGRTATEWWKPGITYLYSTQQRYDVILT